MKFDNDRRAKYLALRRRGVPHGRASEGCGVTRQCVFNHITNDENFARAVKDAEESATDEVESVLWKRAVGGDFRAIDKWLSAKRPEVFQQVARHEFRGLIGQPSSEEAQAQLAEYQEVLKELAAANESVAIEAAAGDVTEDDVEEDATTTP